MTRWNARFDFTAPVPAADQLRRAHFIAIGGAGMSAVARLMLERGVEVSGSDAHDSATLDELRAAGARVSVGQHADNVADLPPDALVVVSSAIREDNPELVAARARGARVLHRAQGLSTLLAGHRVAAVAGANGKTTTTAMLVAALQAAGRDPSFAVGATLPLLVFALAGQRISQRISWVRKHNTGIRRGGGIERHDEAG